MECLIKDSAIYYQEFGQGKPVICLHGFPEDHRAMIGCFEPLFKNDCSFRRIYIDLPGMGRSPKHPDIKNADDMLTILELLIDKLIGVQSFLLAGQSYGGYLSLGLAYRLSMKIDGIFLVCPCVVSEHKRRKLPKKRIAYIEDGLVERLGADTEFKDFMTFAVVINSDTWHRYKEEILPGLKAADTAFTEAYQKDGYSFSFENELKTLRVDKPVHILTGRYDNCVGYEDAWAITQSFTNLTFTTLTDAGHNLQIEQLKFFEFYFNDWLSKMS